MYKLRDILRSYGLLDETDRESHFLKKEIGRQYLDPPKPVIQIFSKYELIRSGKYADENRSIMTI